MVPSGWLILGGDLAVLQAPMFDGFSFDPFSLFDDGFRSAKVGIGGCDVFQALVITLVIIIFDERFNLRFQIAGKIIMLQQDQVFEGLVPTLDLAVGLRMERCTANVAHLFVGQIIRKFARNITWPVVAEQARFVQHMRRRTA